MDQTILGKLISLTEMPTKKELLTASDYSEDTTKTYGIKTMKDDSLTVKETEEGTFIVEWDENDIRYAYLNHLTEEEFNELINTALQEHIDRVSGENPGDNLK